METAPSGYVSRMLKELLHMTGRAFVGVRRAVAWMIVTGLPPQSRQVTEGMRLAALEHEQKRAATAPAINLRARRGA